MGRGVMVELDPGQELYKEGPEAVKRGSLLVGHDQHEPRTAQAELGVVLDQTLLDAVRSHEGPVGAAQVPENDPRSLAGHGGMGP